MDKEKYVHHVFDTIAGDYDAANNRISLGMHMRWKYYAVKKLIASSNNDAIYLDLCCGTGDMAELILNEKPDCKVLGLDFSSEMLKQANKRLSRYKNVSFVEGNAMNLQFDQNSFDGVIISFALRNTVDYEKVISEMVRVTKPGGTISIVDSFVPVSKIIRPFYNIYFSKIMPLLGGGLKKYNEYQWLNQSTEQFISPKELRKIFEKYAVITIEKQFLFGSCVCICGNKV